LLQTCNEAHLVGHSAHFPHVCCGNFTAEQAQEKLAKTEDTMLMKGGCDKWLKLLTENPELLECMQTSEPSLKSTQAVADT